MLNEELKLLKREFNIMKTRSIKQTLRRADVVLGTLASTSKSGVLDSLRPDHFDLVVIDECPQALEADCWVAMMRGARCVLAGDHRQLCAVLNSSQ